MALRLRGISLRRCQQARQLSTTLTAEPPTTQFRPQILQKPDKTRKALYTGIQHLDLAYEGLNLGPRLESARPVASYSLHSSRTSLEPVYNDITCVNKYYPHAEQNLDLAQGYREFIGRYWKLLPSLTTLGVSDMHHTVHALLHAGQQKELLASDIVASQHIIKSIMHGQADFLVTFLDGKMFLHLPEDTRKYRFNTSTFISLFGLPRAYSGRNKDQKHTINLSNIIVKRSIGGLNLLLVDRLDCITVPYKPNESGSHITTKSRKAGADLSSDYKDWYLHLHLMGTPKMLLALRHPETNALLETRVITTSELSVLSGMAYHMSSPKQPEAWPLMDAYIYAFKALCSIREQCQTQSDELELEGIYDRPMTFRAAIKGKSTGTVALELLKVSQKSMDEVWQGTTVKDLMKQLNL